MVLNILKSKYTMVGNGEIESFFCEGKNLENACHLTVDDGDKTFYEIMFPVLKKHNIQATIFVSPSSCKEGKNFWFQEIRNYDEIEMKKIICERLRIDDSIGKYSLDSVLTCLEIDKIWEIIRAYQERFNVKDKEPQNMNLDQLLEIDKSNLVTIGAHTENHPILANESEERSQKEIISSIQGLRNILNHEITCFAYPNGMPKFDFGRREMDVLRDNSCKIAFSTEAKNITVKNKPLSIPRYDISYGHANFIKSKLFLGEYWEIFKNLSQKRPDKERIELKNIMGQNF